MTSTGLLQCGLRPLAVRGDERGSLVALEAGTDVPFPIARVYYIYGTRPGVARGFHAHHDLHQWCVCVHGSCVMTLDDGHERRDFTLGAPDVALQIGPMIWREMRDFSPGAVLMVLASRAYEEADYIRNYNSFLELAKAR